jgi:hypothetical protein
VSQGLTLKLVRQLKDVAEANRNAGTAAKEGTLLKRGKGSIALWKERLVELDPVQQKLMYFTKCKDGTKQDLHGEIYMRSVVEVLAMNDEQIKKIRLRKDTFGRH